MEFTLFIPLHATNIHVIIHCIPKPLSRYELVLLQSKIRILQISGNIFKLDSVSNKKFQ